MVVKKENNLNNYVKTIDLFLQGLKMDDKIKRINFISFLKENSNCFNCLELMENDTYLKKQLIKNELMFNLVSCNSICLEDKIFENLFIKNEKTMSIVLIDYKISIKSFVKFQKHLKRLVQNNNEMSIYVMGQKKANILNYIYKIIINKYAQINLVENNFIDNKKGNRYLDLINLINTINETIFANQTRVMLEKVILSYENKTESDIRKNIIGFIESQYKNGVSKLTINRAIDLFQKNNKAEFFKTSRV